MVFVFVCTCYYSALYLLEFVFAITPYQIRKKCLEVTKIIIKGEESLVLLILHYTARYKSNRRLLLVLQYCHSGLV